MIGGNRKKKKRRKKEDSNLTLKQGYKHHQKGKVYLKDRSWSLEKKKKK